MTRNLLDAIHTILTRDTHYSDADSIAVPNRINAVGDGLESYTKAAFADTFHITDEQHQIARFRENFSWLGNANNPPDFMLHGGDAFEVKKIGGKRSQIQLNSSYPKQTLQASDSRITEACRHCEKWNEKDLVYCIGYVKEKKVRAIWFIYGTCYAATSSTYTRLSDAITSGINQLDMQSEDTNELARVNEVDPLGVTRLRIRGMWLIDHPSKVFSYLPDINYAGEEFKLTAIIPQKKYAAFSATSRMALESLSQDGLRISDEYVRAPDNPADLIDVTVIRYSA